MKLGNGNPVLWSFAAPQEDTPRQIYRIRVSTTGGYTAATAAALDSDGDGLTNLQEITNWSTDPFKADTDEDGILDGNELANGAANRFNMPVFSIVSAWRRAGINKTIDLLGNQPQVSSWDAQTERDGTSAAYLYQLFSSNDYPYWNSGSNPWELQYTASTLWGTGYQIANPIALYDKSVRLNGFRFERLAGDFQAGNHLSLDGVVWERTVRVRASRPMPVIWKIPFSKVSVNQPNFLAAWSQPTVETGFFNFVQGGTYSDTVTLKAAQDAPVPAMPSRTLATGNRPGESQSRSMQMLFFTKYSAGATSGDSDGDGIPNTLEVSMGFDPTKRNSDGMGYADGDQTNQGVLPASDGYLISTRIVDYSAELYASPGAPAPDSMKEDLTTVTDHPAATKYQASIDLPPSYTLGAGLQNKITALSPFPATAPSGWPIPDPAPEVTNFYTNNPYDATAYMDYWDFSTAAQVFGDQCRIWATIPEPLALATTRTLLKVRTETPVGGSSITASITPVTFSVPSNAIASSNYIDLTSIRPTGSPASQLTVKESLISGEIRDIKDSLIPGACRHCLRLLF